MNYVFFNIETTGLDYKKDKILFIECKKYDGCFQKIDALKLYIKQENEISEYVEKITKITNEELKNGDSLENALEKLKLFLKHCHIICLNAEFDLSFLLTAMYNTKIDMNFRCFDISMYFKEKIHCRDMRKLCKSYNVDCNHNNNTYVALIHNYMKSNNIDYLKDLISTVFSKWNIFFRGIDYPESLGTCNKYSFYIADLTEDKYPSYLACLKEIRRIDFTLEELKNLKRNYNIKLLISILDIDEEILQITNDYYIFSDGSKIDFNKKWGRDYIEKLRNAANFIHTYNETIEITCYGTIKELDERIMDKKIMDPIKSKIVREKKKWSRW